MIIGSVLGAEAVATRSLLNINQLIANFEDQLKTMPSESLQLIALTRPSDIFAQLNVLLMQKEEEAEVSKAATIVDTRVVTSAEFPMTATTPKALIVLTGLFLGLSAVIGLVLAQRALSSRFQKGFMSLVGPRTRMVGQKLQDQCDFEDVEGYIARHRVKPGITGMGAGEWVARAGPYAEQIGRRVEHDIYYIESWPIWLDLVILIKTVFWFFGTNAF